MAVTKIRKISSWTLLASSVITVIVLGLFFFGGVVDEAADMKEPNYTNLLLNWGYVIFILTAAATIIFALWQLITAFRDDAKGALLGIGAIILFFVLLFITYSIGNGTLLTNLNADSQKYNTAFWLKITDMWIYSTYVLVGLIILAGVAGSVKKILSK